MSTSPSIEHPSLGQIHGTKPPRLANVDQYLGIQYATLANRFARGTLVETRTSSSPLTATKIGYARIPNPPPPGLRGPILKKSSSNTNKMKK